MPLPVINILIIFSLKNIINLYSSTNLKESGEIFKNCNSSSFCDLFINTFQGAKTILQV